MTNHNGDDKIALTSFTRPVWPTKTLRVIWPHCSVAVNEVRQMVGDQILAGHADVHGVPVLKLVPQAV